MAKDFATVNMGIWGDPDFRGLPAIPQHLYLALWTSPGLSYCGVHDWRPGRLAAMSAGSTAETVRAAAACLAARHFLVIDEETEEVLVRSWMRFDGLMKQPRMAISCINAFADVSSNTLREVIVHELNKIKGLHGDYTCWNDERVAKVLAYPSADPKALPTPDDPFGGELTPDSDMRLPLSLGQTRGGVETPPTPAPAPAPASSTPAPSASRKDDGRKRPARELPDDWKPNAKHESYAATNGLDLDLEAERFRNHAEANDRRLANWDAGFSNWLTKADPARSRPKPADPDAQWNNPWAN